MKSIQQRKSIQWVFFPFRAPLSKRVVLIWIENFGARSCRAPLQIRKKVLNWIENFGASSFRAPLS